MIEARAPDGSVHTFPTGTPDEVVDRTMREYITGTQRQTRAREANSGALGYVGGLSRQALQGLSFGFGDEALAGIQTGAGLWGNYGQALQGERDRNAAFREENPVTSMVANLGGALAFPAAALGRLGVAAGAMLRPAAPGAAMAERLTRSLPARAALAGATGGALAGAGDGEGVLDRVTGAGQGALVGTLGGAALGAGISAAGSIGGRVLNATGLRNPESAAERQILRAFERDGIDPATLLRAPVQGPGLAAPAPEQALVDRGGRNLVNLTAVASNTPGRAMEAADTLMEARRGGRPERIAEAVDDSFGGGGGTRVADEVDALRTQRSTEAAPLYDRAFSRRVPNTVQDFLEPVVASRDGQAALNRAAAILADEHQAAYLRSGNRSDLFNPDDYGLVRAPDGSWRLEGRMENMRLLDAIKRGFDDELEQYRNPITRRLELGEAGRALNDKRAAYVEFLRNHPHLQPYGRALDAWGGPSGSLDALAQGQQALRVNPDQVAAIVRNLAPGDVDFFRLGVGRAITDLARDPATAAGAARRLLEDRNMQRRLAAAIPDPAERALFASAMQREVEMAAVERAVSPRGGSQTGRLRSGADDMEVDAPGGVLLSMLNSARNGGVTGAVSQGLLNIYRRTQGINSNTADALAQRLLSTDQAANEATLQALARRRQQDMATALQRSGAAARVNRALGATAGLETQDY